MSDFFKSCYIKLSWLFQPTPPCTAKEYELLLAKLNCAKEDAQFYIKRCETYRGTVDKMYQLITEAQDIPVLQGNAKTIMESLKFVSGHKYVPDYMHNENKWC
jgi:hypothetical protein